MKPTAQQARDALAAINGAIFGIELLCDFYRDEPMTHPALVSGEQQRFSVYIAPTWEYLVAKYQWYWESNKVSKSRDSMPGEFLGVKSALMKVDLDIHRTTLERMAELK